MNHSFDEAAALAWIRKSLTINHGKYAPFVLGGFSAQVVEKFWTLGIDVGNRELALDYDGVRHTYVKHGNKLVELARNQRAVVAADFLFVPSILEVGQFQIGDPVCGRDGTKRLEVNARLMSDAANENFSAIFSIRKNWWCCTPCGSIYDNKKAVLLYAHVQRHPTANVQNVVRQSLV